MVVVFGADALDVCYYCDVGFGEDGAVADAGALEEERSATGTAGEDDLFAGFDSEGDALGGFVVDEEILRVCCYFYACGPLVVVEKDSYDFRLGEDVEVWMLFVVEERMDV